jgi:hypothetical protein
MSYSTCIDLSLPLEIRLEATRKLSENDQDSLLEHVCSAYVIHSTFIALQYLHYLILEPSLSLTRRIRVAEMCDLGLSVLYLVTRFGSETEKVRCIEMFTNPYLKLHAYNVLYTCASLDTQIQIMKNIFTLPGVSKDNVLDWFIFKMTDDSVEYKYQSNCADAVLNRSRDLKQVQLARQVLQIDTFDDNPGAVYQHRENVHLFLPNLKVLDQILEYHEKSKIEEIISFIQSLGYTEDLFCARILNDTTRFGRNTGTTLEDLFLNVWPQLSEDLKTILIEDIYTSEVPEEAWMCTTGYYNRILNVYQAMLTDQHLFESQQEFTSRLTQRINHYLVQSDEKDEIILELPHSSEERRIRYLTFKVHALPLVLKELRTEFSNLSDEGFDECFVNALRQYENTL